MSGGDTGRAIEFTGLAPHGNPDGRDGERNSGMRWTRGGASGALSGRWARIAGLCCVVLLAALMPAARAEVARQDADVTLGYACHLPSGLRQATVRIRASFPARTEPSAVIEPSNVAVTVTFPRAVADEILGPEAATVAGSARLGVLATQANRPSGTEWSGLSIPRTGASRPLRITASGPVPSSTAGAQGDVIFSAGVLALRLDVRKSGGTPAAAMLECTPNLGQSTTLATVPLVGAAEGGGSGAGTAQAPGIGTPGAAADGPRTTAEPFCPPPPDPPEFNKDLEEHWPPLRGAQLFVVNGTPACATVDGRSNVNKLKGAAPMRGISSIIVNKELWLRPGIPPYVQQRHVARTDLIPTRATFLTFDFMPTTAEMEIKQIGNMNIAVEREGTAFEGAPLITTAIGEVSIRVVKAWVNGTPLKVGPNCRTADKMLLIAHGRSDSDPPYLLDSGGQLTATVAIPEFTGCGTDGDDLDRLLTASISGPGNFLRLLQGTLCDPARNDPVTPCPPGAYGFTITPGGEFRGTFEETPPAVFSLDGLGVPLGSLTCGTSTITGNLGSGPQIPPEKLGQVTGFSFGDCVGSGELEGKGRFAITANGLPATLRQPLVSAIPNGQLSLQFRVPRLRAESDACRLDFVAPPGANSPDVIVDMIYNNRTKQLQLTALGNAALVSDSPGCPNGGTVSIQPPFAFYEGIDQHFRFGGAQPPLP
jgi:hypothetical protein